MSPAFHIRRPLGHFNVVVRLGTRIPAGGAAAIKSAPQALNASSFTRRASTAGSLRDRLGRERPAVGPVREICGNVTGIVSGGQNDNACGIHTLHFPHYAATLPPR
nr:hypothetical protein [Bradyrhizobium sp.]